MCAGVVSSRLSPSRFFPRFIQTILVLPAQLTMRSSFLIALIVFVSLSHCIVVAFVQLSSSSPPLLSTTTSLNIFGGFGDAFKNDDSLGKAKDAGLSTGPKYNEQVTVNGRAIPKVVIDQKISQVCNAARVKVPYNCQNGECGTCTVLMNGKKIRACVSKVPAGKCAIQTL